VRDASRREFLALDVLIRIAHASTSPALSAAHRSDDLDPVAVVQHGRLVRALRGDLTVHCDGGVLALDVEMHEQPFHVQAVGDFQVLSVDADLHKQNGRVPLTGAAAHFVAVFPSLELPRSGSRGPGPHPVLRNPPPTTSRRSIPPRTGAQTRVSWRPGLAITRGSAPSTHLAPGESTTDAERT